MREVNQLTTPVRRRFEHFVRLVQGSTRFIGYRHMGEGIPVRIKHSNEIRTVLMNAVHESIGIGVDVSAINGNFVVEIFLWAGPIPLGDDDVSFDTLRTRGSRRQRASLDTIGPVSEFLE